MNRSLAGWTLVVALGLTACAKKEAPKKVDIDNNSSGNPITAPVDYLGAINKAKKSATRTIDTVSLQQSIQVFQANEDHFPKDLNELVAKHYIPEVPTAPAGYRLDYDPKTGSVKMVRQP